MTVRLMIVDDHEVVRIGLKAVLEGSGKFTVVAEADTAEHAISRADLDHPEVILMDLRLPDGNGVEVCREIRSRNPEIKVLILTSYTDEEAVVAAILAGASGYLLKKIWSDDLLKAVETVSRGGSLLDPLVTGQVLDYIKSVSQGPPDELEQLTPQEKKVLALMAQAKTNKEISQELYLSEKTVRNYVSSIFKKLKIENRSQAVLLGRKLSWFTKE